MIYGVVVQSPKWLCNSSCCLHTQGLVTPYLLRRVGKFRKDLHWLELSIKWYRCRNLRLNVRVSTLWNFFTKDYVAYSFLLPYLQSLVYRKFSSSTSVWSSFSEGILSAFVCVTNPDVNQSWVNISILRLKIWTAC